MGASRSAQARSPWTLNEEESEAFYTLRERVADLDIVDRCMLSRDDFILRFLIARHYDVDVARGVVQEVHAVAPGDVHGQHLPLGTRHHAC